MHILTLILIAGLTLIQAHAVEGGHLIDQTDPAFPALVQIIGVQTGSTEMYGCSGTFIAPNLVVTAAHCVTDDKTSKLLKHTKFYVHRGDLNGDWFKTLGQDHEVWAEADGVEFNPAYVQMFKNNDIAVVRVSFPDRQVYMKPNLGVDFIAKGTKVRVLGSGPSTPEEMKNHYFNYKTLKGALTGRMVPQWGMVEVNFIADPVAGDQTAPATPELNFGDSGGPSLVVEDGVETVWAVESQASQFISLGHNREWLLKAAHKLGVDLL